MGGGGGGGGRGEIKTNNVGDLYTNTTLVSSATGEVSLCVTMCCYVLLEYMWLCC